MLQTTSVEVDALPAAPTWLTSALYLGILLGASRQIPAARVIELAMARVRDITAPACKDPLSTALQLLILGCIPA